MRLVTLTAIFFTIGNAIISEDEVGITVRVDPGKVECFWHTITNPKAGSMEVNWIVLKGGSGLDISFTLRSPSQQLLADETAKMHGRHTVDLSKSPIGDYVMCFDNKISTTANKIVALHVYVMDKDGNFMSDLNELEQVSAAHLEARLDFFEMATGKIKTHLSQIESIQQALQHIEYIDRTLAETNFENINFWGTVNTLVMLTACFVQVFLIRSILSDDSKVGRLLRKGKM
ncbi:unnamed protein product, partial [Mesorhabditis belari]|uniref:GOLD domain-containing protein n=1 Tax=Mesorhabditis belari TaxID=2138241 RepID=A0AAF3EC89_9BILA